MMNNPLQLMATLSQTQNPIALMTQMFGNNPQFGQVMQIAQGKSPQELEQYVRNAYKTQGVDITTIAKQFGIPI